MKVCERCGTPNDDGAQFCDTCGTPLAAGASRGAPAQPPPTQGPAGAPAQPPPATGGDAPTARPPAAGGAPTRIAPAPPGGGGSGGGGTGDPWPPPAPPPGGGGRSTTLAVVAGLLAFLVVGAVGAGAYFGLIKKDDAKTATTTTNAPPPRTSSTATTQETTPTTSTTGPSTPAKFRVQVCGRLSPARRCGAPGFNRSRNVKQFYLWLAVLDAPKRKAVRLLLVDRSTKKNLVSPTRYVTTGAKKNIFTLRISGGPFKQLRAAILVKYGREAINFKPPVRLSLR